MAKVTQDAGLSRIKHLALVSLTCLRRTLMLMIFGKIFGEKAPMWSSR
jgi:hypothetical protein